MNDIRNMSIWKKQMPDQRSNDAFLKTDIADLSLSVRSFNCLKRSDCHTVGDIVRIIESTPNGLKTIRNLGARSESEILARLQELEVACVSQPSPAVSPSPAQVLIRPAKNMWNCSITEFPLSDYARNRLLECGIHTVRDLYATNPKQEPGWYAVRELFRKIMQASPTGTDHSRTNHS